MPKSKTDNTQTRVNEVDGMTMVWVPPGSFLMGAPDSDTLSARNEKPQVNVVLTKGFWMCRTVVTQKAFAAIMGEEMIRTATRGENYPVTDVSLAEIFAYCDKVGGRLASEAEWEWAARGGTTSHRPAKPKDFGWFNKNSKGELQAVAQKKPNEFGLYDMMGNVVESTSTPWSFELIGGTDPGHGDRNIDIERVTKSGSFANSENMMSATSRAGNTIQNKIPEKPWQVQNTHSFRYVMD
jgi:formylglycine-generating enzyme required for sulfatase activity